MTITTEIPEGYIQLLSQPKNGGVYLSKTLTPNQEQLVLQRGMILVTCSGIIGRTVLINGDLEGCIGSPDLLRIIPDEQQAKLGFFTPIYSAPLVKC